MMDSQVTGEWMSEYYRPLFFTTITQGEQVSHSMYPVDFQFNIHWVSTGYPVTPGIHNPSQAMMEQRMPRINTARIHTLGM
jgi:hypothetical protein